ncbi:hypothetical protein D3C85_1439560 [compost metagenome]
MRDWARAASPCSSASRMSSCSSNEHALWPGDSTLAIISVVRETSRRIIVTSSALPDSSASAVWNSAESRIQRGRACVRKAWRSDSTILRSGAITVRTLGRLASFSSTARSSIWRSSNMSCASSVDGLAMNAPRLGSRSTMPSAASRESTLRTVWRAVA